MDAVSAALTLKALDGLSMRAAATAHNIANAGSPGFRPVQVSFEDALAAAANRSASSVRAVAPAVEPQPVAAGAPADVRLDLELAAASTTAARYSALVEVLNRQLQIDGLAVAGGR